MKVYYLKANKTKMVKLLRDKGYHPSIKKAKFQKLFRARSWWLTWMESDGFYEAHLTSAAGRPFLRVEHDGERKYITLTSAELDRYDMKEEINNEGCGKGPVCGSGDR